MEQPNDFELACRSIEPKCEGTRFLVGAVVDKHGVVVALDPHAGEVGFFCEHCGEKAIAWLPGKAHTTIGNQVDLREALCRRRGEDPWEKCPSCLDGIQPVVCAVTETGPTGPTEIACPDCSGKGQIPSGYAERKRHGEVLRQRRIMEGLSLREWCIKNGEDPARRSKLERGFLVL